MTMRIRILAGVGFLLMTANAAAQVRMVEQPTSGTVNVTFTHPDDQAQAGRIRDLVFRIKPVADPLFAAEDINVELLHSQRELDLRLGPARAGQPSGASYVHGILFLSPLVWPPTPTDEALVHAMEEALVRYSVLQLTGGHHLPDWLERGLIEFLAKREHAVTTADLVAGRAELLLGERDADDPAVGYWAVRYLIEQRGGLPVIQRLLRMTAQRPDSFLGNLGLVYDTRLGQLERDWRAWLKALVAEDKRQREGGVRRGPLVPKDN